MNGNVFWAVLLSALAVGCGDDDMTTAPDMPADLSMDMPPTGLCPTGTPLLEELAAPAFLVVGSDFSATSVGVLGATGEVLADTWIDSGTTAPGLVATLSGDVALPTDAAPDALALVDRFGTDVVTRLCADGSLVGQVRLTPEATSLNLQDVVVVDATMAWASRQEGNGAAAMELDRGTDLIGFDPTTMMPNGMRVDLSAFDTVADGIDTSTGDPATDVAIGARPARMTRVGDTIVVALALLPVDLFGDRRAHGQGTLALVDVATGAVEGYELPAGLANCLQVLPVADSSTDVIVACQGYGDAGFGDVAGVRATAGIVRLRIAGGAPSLVAEWVAQDVETTPLAGWNVVSLGGNRVATVSVGDFATVPDVLWELDLDTDAFTELARGSDAATGSFVLGQGAFASDLLLVPDAEAGTLRRFTVGAATTEGEAITVGPATLAPRSVQAL